MRSSVYNTRAYQLGERAGVSKTRHTVVRLTDVVKHMQQDLDNIQFASYPTESFKVPPERDALRFYLLNHAVGLISRRVAPLEDLGPYLPIVELYHQQLAVMSTRMFYYLLLICTRESRHDTSGYTNSCWDDISTMCGTSLKSFHTTIQGVASSKAVAKFLENPPPVSLGDYTSALAYLFLHGTYMKGYGGVAWANVAEVLRRFVHGEYSAEMMLDTAFTLCHNNGPIFNKGMLFDSYSTAIYKILDVQRSGQIPQLIYSLGVPHASDKEVQLLWEQVHSVLGDEVTGPVDWFAVEALGSLQKYPLEKASMQKTPTEPKPISSSGGPKKTKLPSGGAPSVNVGLEIMPGVIVKTTKVRP